MILIAILVKASLLLAAAACVHLLIGRRLSAAARHLWWTGAIVGLLLLPVLSTLLPVWTIGGFHADRIASVRGVDDGVAMMAGLATEVRSSMSTALPLPIRRPFGPRALSWNEAAIALYVIGILLFLARLAAQQWRVQRLLRRTTPVENGDWSDLLAASAARLGVHRRVRLLNSVEESMPMACGTLQPAIVIPAVADAWPEERRRAVLLHELAHVARHDCLTQTLAALMCALYWMHPAAWWLARRLRVERELACDDRVVSTGTDAQDYAGHLLELAYALRPAAPALAVSMAAPGQLEGRLRALLDARRPRHVPRLGARVAVLGMMTLLLVTIAAAGLSRSAAFAAESADMPLLAIQDPPAEAFEVATVRENTSTETGGFIQRRPGGSFSVGNQTLLTLITFAYQLQRGQLVGAPDWINTTRYDIVARAGRDIPPAPFGAVAPEAIMLRALLADRFKLAVHREAREMPIYALTLARSDGQLGPRLRRPTNDYCEQRRLASAKGPLPPGLPTDPVCGISGTGSELTAGSFPLSSFTGFLAGPVRRPVVDRTGLTGEWDFDLKWNPDPTSTDTERPAIFTALQEQLGLKLEATTGPVDILVVDRVERPVPD
jgi:uncharacterized protein (TIGR03435 family)